MEGGKCSMEGGEDVAMEGRESGVLEQSRVLYY